MELTDGYFEKAYLKSSETEILVAGNVNLISSEFPNSIKSYI